MNFFQQNKLRKVHNKNKKILNYKIIIHIKSKMLIFFREKIKIMFWSKKSRLQMCIIGIFLSNNVAKNFCVKNYAIIKKIHFWNAI